MKIQGVGGNMSGLINLNDIYDKNVNFLIGAGASHGLFPTLSLAIKGADGEEQTIETLATLFGRDPRRSNYTWLFMHYYKNCIEPVIQFDIDKLEESGVGSGVIDNYKTFIENLLVVLQRRRSDEKTCNIFTTNYDGCLEHASDRLLQSGVTDFVINDGARGFMKRYLHVKNFNTYLCQTGVFERHRSYLPQINLIHLHGSIYWHKKNDAIVVNYENYKNILTIDENIFNGLHLFSEVLNNPDKSIDDLPVERPAESSKNSFWDAYNRLPIVNPNKWKFHETVFDEHYYQMLRLLSYELEKPNTILITFGFSFADEHILNLVKRSLANPSLQIFVCCYNSAELIRMKCIFRVHRNVQFVTVENLLDFKAFNREVFTLKQTRMVTHAEEVTS